MPRVRISVSLFLGGGVGWGHNSIHTRRWKETVWVGFLSSSQFQLGMPCFCLVNILGTSEELFEKEHHCQAAHWKPLIYSLPLPTKKQANTSINWLWKCFCLRLYNWFFFSMPLSYSAWTGHQWPVAEDGCCCQSTTENRVNSTGLAILSIPVPFESPWIAIRAMHVWSLPVGGSVSTILPLLLSGVLGTNSVL